MSGVRRFYRGFACVILEIFFAAACIFNIERIEEFLAAWYTKGQNCMDNAPELKMVNTVKIVSFQNLCA